MLRLTLAAAALALASAGDQFCFDHAGTPTGRAITAGTSAAILPGRALNEIFPGGVRIVPQSSTLEENNGDRSAPACQPHFEAYRECKKQLLQALRAANAGR